MCTSPAVLLMCVYVHFRTTDNLLSSTLVCESEAWQKVLLEVSCTGHSADAGQVDKGWESTAHEQAYDYQQL